MISRRIRWAWAFFVFEVESLPELYDLIGPELYGSCHVEVQPIMPLQEIGPLFEKWGREGC